MFNHLLTGEELSSKEIEGLIESASKLKKNREGYTSLLQNQHLALLFEKPSLRTRFSFSIAMRELGGDVVDFSMQANKKEQPKDMAQVLSGYCHAIMLRTHDDENLKQMSEVASIPVINGLSALHHPCQILSDLLTLKEHFGPLKGLKICYIGDGNNILHSLLLIAPKVGIEVHYSTPPGKGPNVEILKKAKNELIFSHPTPKEAVASAHAVYTDVWTSMGFEESNDEGLFQGFQVNESLMQHALAGAIFMHCMPMCRGKEVSTTLPDHPQSVIFQQSENRLHMQKAILIYLLKGTFV
jgi:ornithine carbamoyltransferase